MKILVINGSGGGSGLDAYLRAVMDSLAGRGHEVKELVLRDMDCAPCRGCFTCWVKTPGLCVYRDDGDILCREFVRADVVVLAAPVVLGYPSTLLKNALDRIIPIVHPYLEDVGGEVHHMKRYKKYPALALLLEKSGDTDEEDIEIMQDIYRRSAINLQSSLRCVQFTNSPAEEAVHAIINN